MDAHTKLTIAAGVVGFAGVMLMGMANDSESGDRAKNIAWFLIGIGLASVFILIGVDNEEQIQALGHRAVVFCGFGG